MIISQKELFHLKLVILWEIKASVPETGIAVKKYASEYLLKCGRTVVNFLQLFFDTSTGYRNVHDNNIVFLFFSVSGVKTTHIKVVRTTECFFFLKKKNNLIIFRAQMQIAFEEV